MTIKNYFVYLICLFLNLSTFIKAQISESDPEWWKYTTIYEIYVRSYQDSDGDGNGDIKGIISRLDYIKSLGIETIWITPIYPSPQKDWGYDITDYKAVNSEFGTMEDAEQLIEEVHKRGMKIIFDMVFNHTSDEHPWFIESSSSKDNPKRDWYVWNEGRNGLFHKDPINNWVNVVNASGWNFSEATQEFYYAAFFPFQPDLNLRNPEVIEELKGIMRFWLDKGVDGFRFDLFTNCFEDEQLRSNPFTLTISPPRDEPQKLFFQNMIYTWNLEEIIPYSVELRSVLDEYPNKMGITETFANLDFLKRIQKDGPDAKPGINQTMLLDFLFFFDFTKQNFEKELNSFIEYFSEDGYTMTHTTGNHDRRRAMDMVGRGNDDLAKMLALFQFTASGNALFFQGEEIGMTQGNIPDFNSLDPTTQGFLMNILGPVSQIILDAFGNTARIINRDNTRIPMQWDDDQKNAGFSTADDTWLPVYGDKKSIWSVSSWFFTPNKVNVADQENDPNSMLNAYREIISLRNNHETIKKGNIRISPLTSGNKSVYVLGYERNLKDETYLVLINFANDYSELPIKKEDIESVVYETVKNKLQLEDNKIILPPHSGIVLKMNNQTDTIKNEEQTIDDSTDNGNSEISIEDKMNEETEEPKEKIKEELNMDSKILLSPIPTKDKLMVNSMKIESFILKIEILDLTGQLILKIDFDGKYPVVMLDLTMLKSGKYILRAEHTNGKVANEFFIKE